MLLNRVKAELPTCQLLIVLERETKALVREALDSFADGVIFKSSLGTGRGDLIGALRTIAEGGVYFPEDIRRLGAAQAPNPNLPPLIEELTERSWMLWRGWPVVSPTRARHQPRHFVGDRENPCDQCQRQARRP